MEETERPISMITEDTKISEEPITSEEFGKFIEFTGDDEEKRLKTKFYLLNVITHDVIHDFDGEERWKKMKGIVPTIGGNKLKRQYTPYTPRTSSSSSYSSVSSIEPERERERRYRDITYDRDMINDRQRKRIKKKFEEISPLSQEETKQNENKNRIIEDISVSYDSIREEDYILELIEDYKINCVFGIYYYLIIYKYKKDNIYNTEFIKIKNELKQFFDYDNENYYDFFIFLLIQSIYIFNYFFDEEIIFDYIYYIFNYENNFNYLYLYNSFNFFINQKIEISEFLNIQRKILLNYINFGNIENIISKKEEITLIVEKKEQQKQEQEQVEMVIEGQEEEKGQEAGAKKSINPINDLKSLFDRFKSVISNIFDILKDKINKKKYKLNEFRESFLNTIIEFGLKSLELDSFNNIEKTSVDLDFDLLKYERYLISEPKGPKYTTEKIEIETETLRRSETDRKKTRLIGGTTDGKDEKLIRVSKKYNDGLDANLYKYINKNLVINGFELSDKIIKTKIENYLENLNKKLYNEKKYKYIIDNASTQSPLKIDSKNERRICCLTSVCDGQKTCQSIVNEYGIMNFSVGVPNNIFYNGQLYFNKDDRDLVPYNITIEANPIQKVYYELNIKFSDKDTFNEIIEIEIKNNNKELEAHNVLNRTLARLFFYESPLTDGIPTSENLQNWNNIKDRVENIITDVKDNPSSTSPSEINNLFEYIYKNLNDENINLYRNILYFILFKGTGDIFQEINAVCNNGGYTSNITYQDPDNNVVKYEPTDEGNTYRLFLANDQPSAVRFIFLRSQAEQNTINQKSFGGYYGSGKYLFYIDDKIDSEDGLIEVKSELKLTKFLSPPLPSSGTETSTLTPMEIPSSASSSSLSSSSSYEISGGRKTKRNNKKFKKSKRKSNNLKNNNIKNNKKFKKTKNKKYKKKQKTKKLKN